MKAAMKQTEPAPVVNPLAAAAAAMQSVTAERLDLERRLQELARSARIAGEPLCLADVEPILIR